MRIALADDSRLFRDGLKMQLESAGVDVVLACETGDDLIAHIDNAAPDIAIVDIQMPPTMTDEGIRTAEKLRAQRPDLGVLVLSTYVEPAYAAAVVSIGSNSVGYLLKDRVTSLDSLVDALERIDRGESVIDTEVVQALLQRPKRQSALERLTDRERSVLQHMAEGMSNASIARELTLTVRTIEAHSASIFDKLDLAEDPNANRRVQAVITWLRGY